MYDYKYSWGGVLNQYRIELFGIAAIFILIGHSQDFVFGIFPDSIRSIIGYGGIGVTMFAFLSGVGLWQSFERPQDLKSYYLRRLQRVVVPYLLISIPFNLILDVVIQKDFYLFISDVSCISFWTKYRGAWYVAWIIPIYIIYPLYAKLTHKRSWISIVVAMMLVTFIAIWSIPTHFESAAGATISFLCGDYAGKYIKDDSPKTICLMFVGILIAPFYILRIISGQSVYVCFFALVGIGICALFSILIMHFPIWLTDRLKAVGKVSLECYLFNIYLISVSRIIFGDGIYSSMGVITYIAIIFIGIALSFLMGEFRERSSKT